MSRRLTKTVLIVILTSSRSLLGAPSDEPIKPIPASSTQDSARVEIGRQLLDAFIASGSDRLDEIRDALTDNDMPRLTRAAHAVRGAGASMHAEEVRIVAARLESAAQAGMDQSLAQLVTDLSQAIERAISELRPLCSATGSSPVYGSSAVGG